MEYGCINSGLFYILNFHGPFHLLNGKKTVQLLAKKRLKIIVHSIYYFIFQIFFIYQINTAFTTDYNLPKGM